MYGTKVAKPMFSSKDDMSQVAWDNPEATLEAMVNREHVALPLHGNNNIKQWVPQAEVTQTPGN